MTATGICWICGGAIGPHWQMADHVRCMPPPVEEAYRRFKEQHGRINAIRYKVQPIDWRRR
jgi:hypothetical protein